MNAEDTLNLLISLTDSALATLVAAQAASAILKQAHDEGWLSNDPRWDEKWAEADLAQARARARLD